MGYQTVLIASEGYLSYFVVGTDGSKYGPADLALLNQWARESRLMPATVLEEEGTGRRFAAQQLPGLTFGIGAPQPMLPFGGPMGPAAGYNMDPRQYSQTAGNDDVTWAWVLGVIGLFCCPVVFSSIGIVLANNAQQKGHPKAHAALVFCIVSLVLGLLSFIALGVVSAGH